MTELVAAFLVGAAIGAACGYPFGLNRGAVAGFAEGRKRPRKPRSPKSPSARSESASDLQ